MKTKSYAERRLEEALVNVFRQMSLMFTLALYERDNGKPTNKNYRSMNAETTLKRCDDWMRKTWIAGLIVFAFVASCIESVWAVFNIEDSYEILLPWALGLIATVIVGIFHIGYEMREGAPSKKQMLLAREWRPLRDLAEESGVANVAALVLAESKRPGVFDQAAAVADISDHLRGVILSILISKMRDEVRLIRCWDFSRLSSEVRDAIKKRECLEQLAESLGFEAESYDECEEDPAALDPETLKT